MNFEAFLFDSVYDYQVILQTASIHTSIGDNPFTLNTKFTGEPKKPWFRFQFLLPEVVACERLEIEFSNITKQKLIDFVNPTINLVITNLSLIQHYDFDPLCILASKLFYNSKETS